MPEERFRAAEDAYFELRRQFDSGRITEQQFEAQLRELMVRDARGRDWMLGANTGNWYFYDGLNWVPGNPFDVGAVPPVAQLRSAAIPESGGCFSFLPILVSILVITLLIGTFLLYQNRESLFGNEQGRAQNKSISLPTQTSILHANTSEPDFFNTNTPVSVRAIPTTEMPTREPTTPFAIVIPTQQQPSNIPTITAVALVTPVPQPSPLMTIPVATPLVPPAATSPQTGRLRVGNGPDARAQYMPVSQFILDGSLNEWNGDGVPLTVPHIGADNWSGPRDLSGTAWLGWNENFLLIAVKVSDEAHVQTQRSWEMFRGDSVELWIDADLEGDFDVAAGNGDDYQFGFSPGDFAGLLPEGVLYIPYRDATVNQQILVAAQPNSAGYTLEAAVPWTVLRVQPASGRAFGYAVDLSDNDVPGTAQQQTQVTEDPNFQFEIPTTFGNLILE